MQRQTICALSLMLAGCNTDLAQAPRLAPAPGSARYATITPDQARPGNPAVATDRGVLAYADDLDACKAGASARLGGEEAGDLAALRRAVRQGPLGGSVSVGYAPTDIALSRDKFVKDCLSRRGYLVAR